jgi:hypothetical protein
MAKRANAPKGFYSASDVMKILGIGNSTLYHYVDTGKIKKVVPPDRQEGYYIKTEIDKMVRAREMFTLQYASDESDFEKATSEDIEGIASLYVDLFGGNHTTRTEMLTEWYNSNKDMTYITKQDNIIVGYVIVMPLKHEAIQKIMDGLEENRFRTELLTKNNITPFEIGKTEEAFLLIGVKQGLKRSKHYGSRTISGGIEAMESLARTGVILKRLYATSRTQGGIRIAKGLGFKQITPKNEEDDLLRFELDLETTKSPFFKKYQQVAKRAGSKQNKDSRSS